MFIGSITALGFAGLAWLVIENEILYLKSRAFINETAAVRTQSPQDKAKYEEISDSLTRRANLAERIQLLNPWTYIIPSFRRLYAKYATRIYKGSGQY